MSATAGRAPDPNFTGAGRCLTDADGTYRFTTIRPGAYPWRNSPNAWRPAHLHFSLFGRSFTQRLVTQMYFPDDPLFFQDPIYNSVPERSRHALIATYDHDTTTAEWALGFRFDMVLRGPDRTPFEDRCGGGRMTDDPPTLTPSQTVGPFLHLALADPALRFAVAADAPGAIHIHGTVTDGAGAAVPDALIETWQADGLFARCPTDGDGRYEIHTHRPQSTPTVDGTPQAPHLSVSVFARGLLDRVVTRIYFPEDEAVNAVDPTLSSSRRRTPSPARRRGGGPRTLPFRHPPARRRGVGLPGDLTHRSG